MDARLQRLASSPLMQWREPFCRGAAAFPGNASSRIHAKIAGNSARIWHCSGPRVSAEPVGPPSSPWHRPAFRACSAASIFPNRTERLTVRTAAARRDQLLKGEVPLHALNYVFCMPDARSGQLASSLPRQHVPFRGSGQSAAVQHIGKSRNAVAGSLKAQRVHVEQF